MLNKCLSPFRKKGNERKNIDDYDIPCGVCLPCLRIKTMENAFRIYQQSRQSLSSYFITMTYDGDQLPMIDSKGFRLLLEGYEAKGETLNRRSVELLKEDATIRAGQLDQEQKVLYEDGSFKYEMSLSKKDGQMFLDRLRKRNMKDNGVHPKYFMCGEYGGDGGRPHLHAIVFDVSEKVIGELQSLWLKGRVDCKPVIDERIHYVAKYVHKKYDQYPVQKRPFHMHSQNLGGDYLSRAMIDWHQEGDKFYAVWDGFKVKLPRYYREKIWNKEQRGTRIKRVNAGLLAQNKERLEYWKEWSRLKAKGIADPDAYMYASRDNEIELQTKKNKKR